MDAATAATAATDAMPLSSDALLAQLDGWGIAYQLHSHVPLRTVEEAKQVEAEMELPGGTSLKIKNLYLRDRKKRNYLVSVEQDRAVDLKALGKEIGAAGLSFGSADRLMQNLGILPGAVSPLSMVNGVKAGVIFYMDVAAKEVDAINMHPLVNDRTVVMERGGFLTFMERIGCEIRWV